MFSLKVAIVLSLLNAVLICARPAKTNNVNGKEPKQLFERNWNRSFDFKCNKPQNLTFLSENLYNDGGETLGSAESIYPYIAVLHRCDRHSGCCLRPKYECTSLANETVNLTFRIVNQVTKDIYFKTIVAYNDTKCGCKSNRNQPKR